MQIVHLRWDTETKRKCELQAQVRVVAAGVSVPQDDHGYILRQVEVLALDRLMRDLGGACGRERSFGAQLAAQAAVWPN